jgi:membrane glycosyltransferase
MIREKLLINQEHMWRALFGEQRTTLTLAVEMLLRCQLSPEQILTKTMMAMEGSHQDS